MNFYGVLASADYATPNIANRKARTPLTNKWKAPCKSIYEVGKPKWMRCATKLSDIQQVRFVLEDRRLVVMHIEVIWSRKQRYYGWDTSLVTFPAQPVSTCIIKEDLEAEK